MNGAINTDISGHAELRTFAKDKRGAEIKGVFLRKIHMRNPTFF